MQINALYNQFKEEYKDLFDFFAGERQVKKEKERYTPMLESQTGKLGLYERYVAFGILFNALHRTRQGLKGAILRKPVDVTFPEAHEEVLDTVMLNGASFEDLLRESCENVLGYGRYGVLVDIDEQEVPYAAAYPALSILNWPENKSKKVKQEILLSESIEIPDPEDLSKTKTVEQRRKLELDAAGLYVVTVYRKTDEKAKTGDEGWMQVAEEEGMPNPRMPVYHGKRLNFIPFVFFGSSSNIPAPSRPPLLDLLNILKGHWRLTVAYQYGLHFAGLPTPWFAGFQHESGTKTPLGPGAAYFADDPNATCGFLQTGGEGLASMENGLDRLEKQMAVVGARLLEDQRPGVEAAETVRLRSSGDSATLADIAGNVEAAMLDVLQYIGFWLGVAPTACSVGVNKDFVGARLSAQEITSLVAAVQSGKMSEETFIWNLQQGEILQPGRSIEEEQEALAEDRLTAQRNALDFQNTEG